MKKKTRKLQAQTSPKGEKNIHTEQKRNWMKESIGFAQHFFRFAKTGVFLSLFVL